MPHTINPNPNCTPPSFPPALQIHEALNSTVLYGHDNLDRFETQDFVIAGGSAERTLQECSQRPTPSMVVVDARRADVLLALLFAIQSTTVRVAGVLLTGATELSAMVRRRLAQNCGNEGS